VAKPQYSYLPDEVAQYLPKNKFPMNNEAEYIRGVHQLSVLFFVARIDQKRFTKQTNFSFSVASDASQEARRVRDLLEYFADNGLLRKYAELLLGRLAHFVDRFKICDTGFSLCSSTKRNPRA